MEREVREVNPSCVNGVWCRRAHHITCYSLDTTFPPLPTPRQHQTWYVVTTMYLQLPKYSKYGRCHIRPLPSTSPYLQDKLPVNSIVDLGYFRDLFPLRFTALLIMRMGPLPSFVISRPVSSRSVAPCRYLLEPGSPCVLSPSHWQALNCLV